MISNAFYEDALALTKQMVAIPSVNGTEGERVVAEFVEDWLRKLPYFTEHPDQLVVRPLKDDVLGRRNVLALACGEKRPSGRTVILHGHHDTVGIDDFGSLREYAFDCDALPEKIRQLTDDPDVLADIASGNWLFGRGAGDMKCGVAVCMLLLRYFIEHRDAFSGNLLFMTNPVEENQHTGVIEALDVLEELQASRGLQYRLALNTDSIPPLFPGDTVHTCFSGASGKILPCFYIIGKPTHVGQCFQGLSASMIAAELVRRIELNLEFVSSCGKEYTIPPTVLKLKDLKATYDVQTAVAAFVYFNLFLYDVEMDQVFAKLRRTAADAMAAVADFTDRQYQAYCQATGAMEYRPEPVPCRVMDYSELYRAAKAADAGIDAAIDRITADGLRENLDRRELTLQIVQELATRANIHTPTTILFLAPPYLPRNMMKADDPRDAEVTASVAETLARAGAEVGETIRLRPVNPYPTDCSYLRADDSDASLQMVVDNFPNMKAIYSVPVQQIKRVNIPAFVVAGSCKDAHKWTERLNLDYTFRKLPVVLLRILEKELG